MNRPLQNKSYWRNGSLTETHSRSETDACLVSSRRYLLEDNLTLLFQPSYRDKWLPCMLAENLIPPQLAMDDLDLSKLPGWSLDDENYVLVILSAACALGLVSHDENWHFTDLLWALTDQVFKEGKSFGDLTIDEALKWWMDDGCLGSLLTVQLQNAWGYFDHPALKNDHTSLQLLSRFAAFSMGFTHTEFQRMASEIGINENYAANLLSAAVTIGVIRFNGIRWMPDVSIGALITAAGRSKEKREKFI